ncbi:hypothetical protein KHQ82_05470 [Mycoplasmatota bacterium]|nr:hypothetical protein KHQ82_05470 [Mycoplasmatota bacterium]
MKKRGLFYLMSICALIGAIAVSASNVTVSKTNIHSFLGFTVARVNLTVEGNTDTDTISDYWDSYTTYLFTTMLEEPDSYKISYSTYDKARCSYTYRAGVETAWGDLVFSTVSDSITIDMRYV